MQSPPVNLVEVSLLSNTESDGESTSTECDVTRIVVIVMVVSRTPRNRTVIVSVVIAMSVAIDIFQGLPQCCGNPFGSFDRLNPMSILAVMMIVAEIVNVIFQVIEHVFELVGLSNGGMEIVVMIDGVSRRVRQTADNHGSMI